MAPSASIITGQRDVPLLRLRLSLRYGSLCAPLGDQLGEMVDPVAAGVDAETVDLPIAVARGDRRGQAHSWA